MTTNVSESTIVSAAIYPPIGVTRVGNSVNEFFIGPEVNQPQAQDANYYRDSSGALKRQAARFRIYGLNAHGNIVKELTTDNAVINWTAQLANQKASWYKFELALDIPEAVDATPSTLRNKSEPDRSKLLIDGGQQQVSGCNIDGQSSQFIGSFGLVNKSGELKQTSVYLGEMRTDEKGRLVMLGGHGKSENLNDDPAVSFGNNEGWYDDTSDGPITAEVTVDGKPIYVKPAWVICAPPDYAPMQKSVRTMWDLMRDVAVSARMLPEPKEPSFTHDILPIFQRMTDLQWVNAGFAAGFGWDSPFDFTSEKWLSRLSKRFDPTNESDTWQELRRTLYNNFRRLDTDFKLTTDNPSSVSSWNPEYSALSPQQWPWIYGDAMDKHATDSPRQFASLTRIQLSALSRWVEGDFKDDYIPCSPAVTSIEDVPLAEQPEMLTKAAMEFCLADAFHPGCELTWPMRTPGMYSEAFRLQHADNTSPTHNINYGPVMTPQITQQPNGPLLSGQIAGGLTRWMAIPWQTDTASCRDGYNEAYDPYLPTFWPARVPNNMLNRENYRKVIDERHSMEDRQQAFNEREFWLDDLPISQGLEPADIYQAQINSMVTNFDKLAIVLPQSKAGITGFPKTMQVGLTHIEPESTVLFDSETFMEVKSKNTLKCRPNLSLTDKANRFVTKG
ncbi:LodA/GoxA family CTQ-dependent oxidase [Photobacterium makurazakiensis]|uniref:LodA/GoxA family CTQ-dependent oxidase n=1 Tax=Photobacterium makurazakiensis TaxID=2910234 RepID=UPI003D0A8928